MTFILPDIDKKELLVGGVKPRLFISYSRANLSQVGSIVKRLEDAYYDPWFDTRDIAGGEDWKREIAKGIQNAQRILFFMTPESCASEYCQGEIAHALKHGVQVIPIRINNKTPDDALDGLGLSGKQFIKWESENEDANWQRLLNDHSMVKPPLPREIRRLEDEYERLHRRYLNTFFRPDFSRVSLSDISEDTPVRGVPLTSVYVPLPVDMSITIRVDEADKKTINDWWVQVEKSDTRADENIPDELRERKLREWLSLRAKENNLLLLLSDVERKLAERAETVGDNFRSEQNWYMEAHDAANVQNRMVLTGIPGSGKSTFLKHLALCLAGDVLKDKENVNIETLQLWTLPAYTPVFIRLADIVRQEFPNADDRADTEDFDLYLQKQLAGWHIEDYWRDLQDQLYDGSAIILLDGLDEVPNAVEKWRRDQIMDFVGAIINEYGKCRVIVTSRPYAYDGTWKLDGFGQTTLIPLHNHRIYELAQALFSQLPNIDDPAQEAEAFVKALHQQGNEDGFWNNPLQFTMGATLWVRNADKPIKERIPPTPALLYDKSVELMLEKWSKRDPVIGASVAELLQVSTKQLRSALERLALQMQSDYGSDNKATFKQWLLIEYLDDCVQETPEKEGIIHQSIDYNRALDLLEQRAGLIASEETRLYRFQHLSYQEYLAACELTKPAYFPHAITEKIIAQPGRWRNVIPLLIDILKSQGQIRLQALARSLLPTQDTSNLSSDDSLWEVIAQTANLYKTHDGLWEVSQKQVLATHLVNLIQCGALAPKERAEMGRILSELGDTREGVGIMTITIDGKPVKLPQIAWCDITAPPDGKFIMGANDQDDNPRREVDMKYNFKMAKYFVTYQQFQTFIDSGEFDDPQWWHDFPENYQPQVMRDQNNPYLNHPRDAVSWYQAVAFSRWLDARCHEAGLIDDSVEIRLPTEQEWEYAARGTDERAYPYVGDFDATKGNTSDTGIGKTSVVGMFSEGRSPFGIMDMSGNLWEWCANNYREPEIIDASNTSSKVLRGGSFTYARSGARASYRSTDDPGYDYDAYGCRLVVAPIAPL
jgi:formylglycine-generating enzyme required for sulfatase activity